MVQAIRIMRANLLGRAASRKAGPRAPRASEEGDQRISGASRAQPIRQHIGYTLPFVVSGSIIVSLVLGLPTVGPLLLRALIAQDMLAGAIVLLLGVMTVIGTLISPICRLDRSTHPKIDRGRQGTRARSEHGDPHAGTGRTEPEETSGPTAPVVTAPSPGPVPAPGEPLLTTDAEERVAVATQAQLMWRRFRQAPAGDARRHRRDPLLPGGGAGRLSGLR